MKKYLFVALLFPATPIFVAGQMLQPDLQDPSQWNLVNRTAQPINEAGKKGIALNEVAGDGLMILKGSDFTDAEIELDIRGSDKFQQSFVGFAFHGNGPKTFDAIYFRPFNFKSDDPQRRVHAVQYISMPEYDWERLRNEFPGKYENALSPAPNANEWFHVKFLIKGKHISVFVNQNEKSVLEVDKLNEHTHGGFGLWVGNNSAGNFANLRVNKIK